MKRLEENEAAENDELHGMDVGLCHGMAWTLEFKMATATAAAQQWASASSPSSYTSLLWKDKRKVELVIF